MPTRDPERPEHKWFNCIWCGKQTQGPGPAADHAANCRLNPNNQPKKK